MRISDWSSDVCSSDLDLPPGRIDARAGRAAYEYLCQAIDDAANGRLRAIVTAPLNKEAMRAGGIDYLGHTEILAERSEERRVGKEWVSTCRSRWSPYHDKKKKRSKNDYHSISK